MGEHADRDARRPVGADSARSGSSRRTTRGRRCSSSSARTRRSPRSSTSGSARTSRRWAFRRRRFPDSATRTAVINTIRVDSKVVHETDTGRAKSDDAQWMRFTLDTVGKTAWPRDSQGRPIYPGGFRGAGEEAGAAAPSAGPRRALHRLRRACSPRAGTATRSRTSSACGRSCRSCCASRWSGAACGGGPTSSATDGLMTEEVAKVFGVPFEVIPFKANPAAGPKPPQKRHHVHALPGRAQLGDHVSARRGLPAGDSQPRRRWTGARCRRCGSTRRRFRPKSR